MNNLPWKKIIIGSLILILIIGCFYWFQLRLIMIRKECYRTTFLTITANPEELHNISEDTYNTLYSMCLHSKGVEK